MADDGSPAGDPRPSAGRVALAVLATLAIMFVVPFPFYGLFELLGWVEMPEAVSPGQFMLGVLVMKVGVALGFVLLFVHLVAPPGAWLWRYAGIWWLMFAIVEVGQAIGPGYTTAEAVAGILAEAIYFPLSALAVSRILSGRR